MYFNQAQYAIYSNNVDAENAKESVMTPSSPSPALGGAAQSGKKSAALATLGIVMGQKIVSQTIGIIRTEIAAGGNEIEQAGVNNILTAGQMATAIYATKGIAVAGYVIQGIADSIVGFRQNTRLNRENTYQRELKDSRISLAQHSAYYGG